MNDFVTAAMIVARLAHAGQTRMDGVEPYINHPRRVAEAVHGEAYITKINEAAAWLHDVVEDSDLTRNELFILEFPAAVVQIVDVLTRRKNELHVTYLDRVALDPRAVRIKIADMRDNLASLPEGHRLHARYTAGLIRLEGD